MARLERSTVQVAPDVRAAIESAARREEISAAAIMRQALRDWATRQIDALVDIAADRR